MDGFGLACLDGDKVWINSIDPCSDFSYFLSVFARYSKTTQVAVDLEGLQQLGKYGVDDILNFGLNIIVVDSAWSPIADDTVRPVWVHRNKATLQKHFPECIVVGKLLKFYKDQRQLEQFKLHFQCPKEGYTIDPLSSGWCSVSAGYTAEKEVIYRLFQYRLSRDYELENQKCLNKQKKR